MDRGVRRGSPGGHGCGSAARRPTTWSTCAGPSASIPSSDRSWTTTRISTWRAGAAGQPGADRRLPATKPATPRRRCAKSLQEGGRSALGRPGPGEPRWPPAAASSPSTRGVELGARVHPARVLQPDRSRPHRRAQRRDQRHRRRRHRRGRGRVGDYLPSTIRRHSPSDVEARTDLRGPRPRLGTGRRPRRAHARVSPAHRRDGGGPSRASVSASGGIRHGSCIRCCSRSGRRPRRGSATSSRHSSTAEGLSHESNGHRHHVHSPVRSPRQGRTAGQRRDAVAQPDSRARDRSIALPAALHLAVEVALTTGRPLLLRGEPGTGKSSLAPYIARRLGWRYYEYVVTSTSTANDLLWRFDAVSGWRTRRPGRRRRKRSTSIRACCGGRWTAGRRRRSRAARVAAEPDAAINKGA